MHTEAPDFMTCSWCSRNYVQNSTFAGAFSAIRKRGRCSFYVPRMVKCLWPDAVRTGKLSTVTVFMSTYAEIPTCKGAAGAVMSDHVNWFKPANDEIPTFMACESYYEGITMSTSFRGRFIPSPHPQGPNDKRSGDMSLEFMCRTLLWRARQKDWLGSSRAPTSVWPWTSAKRNLRGPTRGSGIVSGASRRSYASARRVMPITLPTLASRPSFKRLRRRPDAMAMQLRATNPARIEKMVRLENLWARFE